MASQRMSRFKAEMEMLLKNPPPGIEIRTEEDKADTIWADISGPEGSPFEGGTFTVEVSLSERYPFTPPNARFITQIYHPNVDNTGRICLSGLKPKPAGTWNCSLNIAVILSAIRLLLNEPNLGDPLMADIATEYKDDFNVFRAKAESKTRQYATKGGSVSQSETYDLKTNPGTLTTTTTGSATSLSSSHRRVSPRENQSNKSSSLSSSSKAPTENMQPKRLKSPSPPKPAVNQSSALKEQKNDPVVVDLMDSSDSDFEDAPRATKKARLSN